MPSHQSSRGTDKNNTTAFLVSQLWEIMSGISSISEVLIQNTIKVSSDFTLHMAICLKPIKNKIVDLPYVWMCCSKIVIKKDGELNIAVHDIYHIFTSFSPSCYFTHYLSLFQFSLLSPYTRNSLVWSSQSQY